MWRTLLAVLALALLGAPAVARTTAHRPTLQDLLALYQLGGLRTGAFVSPDGRSVAVFRSQARLASNDYRTDLVLVDLPSGHARIAADAGGWVQAGGRPSGAAMDRVAVWSSDGRSIIFNAERNGHVELWRLNVATGASDALVRGPGDVVDYSFADDGHAIIYRTGPSWERLEAARAERATIGFRVDDAFSADFALAPLDNRLAPEAAWRLDIASRQSRPATEAEAHTFDQALPGLVTTKAPNDHADDPEMTVLARPNDRQSACRDVHCFGEIKQAWSTADGDIVFLRMEDPAVSYSALYRWRPSSGAVQLLRRAEDKLFDCQISTVGLVCVQEAIVQPRRLVIIDPRNGEMRPVYDPNPSWSQFAFGRYERIDIRDEFGNQAFAHLFYPDGYVAGRRYPMVIVQYQSRGFLRGGVGGEYPIQEFARRGFFVLSEDRPYPRALGRHLSLDELEKRTELDQTERTMKMSALDIFIDNVTRRGLVDAHRVGITGLSDGAETLYWAITRSHRFAAAVVSTPPIDPMTWFAGSERFRSRRREVDGLAGPWADVHSEWDSWWRETPPINRAAAISTPLMMQLADAEALPAFGLYSRLREDSKPIEFYLYPDEYHLKWQPRHLLAVQQRALAWMDFWLRDAEDADPQEPDRLARWRQMRIAHAASADATPLASSSTR
ncbi:MAG: Atxe2 family lasso peptide isopeptidase [Vitreimonas sp.]